ncbi:sensor histidine kinase [Mycolicibacterium helvum]|uniref:histidine kinase n=1 Tax=Mycolicibacterium helvum TaxID=1534349 RepID=A0A7I7T9H1_9MYCO|nr:HAMP domain-containing sensor histidine kinase [Mycolicibacterium helvum]BBY65904.1 putative sensor histidine kinase [Mycolicibacterium helvum]
MSRSPGLGTRLLLAQALVLVAGALTTAVVAMVVGPPLFREHLRRAGIAANSHEQFHAEQAYTYATAISVGVAVAAAALTALVVTWYVSRRLQHSLAEVSAAAARIADGRFDARVTPPRLGADFDALASAFNAMATRLEDVETTRRRLLGDLAHEIRTPVAVIEAYLEAIEDGVKSLDSESVSVMRDQGRRLVRLSEDVGALAQAEEGQVISREWVDADALVAAAVAAVADRAGAADIGLRSDVDPAARSLWVDPQRLGQVLGNLLDNALHHTPAGGRVEVSVTTSGGGPVLTVTDTGEGVGEEHLPRLFERFYRVDPARSRSGGGSGIGLAIAKAIVEAHGGRISARSDGPGAGTVFTIELPTADLTT